MVGNKKLMIALFSICLVVIAGLLTTVIVLAAPSANVTSNINISYTAQGIDGSLSAAYVQASTATNEEAGIALKGGDGDSGKVTFTIDNTSAKSGTLAMPENVTVSLENKSIILIYTISNTGSKTIEATLTYNNTNDADDNFKVEYATDASQAESGWSTLSDKGTQKVTVSGGTDEEPTTERVYVRITLEDASQDATFEATLVWALLPQQAAA